MMTMMCFLGRRRGNRRSATAGFTLVEILVVLVIFLILLGLVFMPMYQSFSATKRVETAAMLQDRANLAMSQIVQDLEEAIYVYSPPDVGTYSYPDTPDAMVLGFLDLQKPATEDEVYLGYTDAGGGSQIRQGNANKLAYPTRPSQRIVRYFAAPLPGHPPGQIMWAQNPPGLGGYVNTFIDSYAPQDRENLVTLYRAEFTLDELSTAAGLAPGTLTLANTRTPYFYTGQLVGAPAYNLQGVGQYWRTVSTALTDPETMDCALYRYNPSINGEEPLMLPLDPGDPSRGALPGFTLTPLIIPNEVMVPSESREVTGYHASEGLWGELNYGLIVQANAAGLPVASYPPMGADGAGDDGTRLRPLLNPTTGQLAFARQGSDVFTIPPRPSLPAACGLLQTDAAGPGGTRLFPHLYRVSYGGRLPPLAGDLNVRDARFKVVAESEVVRLVHKATGQVVQCRRVETEPVGPYQYRIDYFTGAIRFDKINYPDPTVFEVWADYQYRDNFTWADADPRGFVDDTVLATYVSRREMTVGLNVTGFDISSGKALPFSLARRIRLRNAIR